MKGIDVIVEQAGSHYQVAVVRVLGQIDTTTSHELERRLQYLLKDRQFEIIIDLGKVTYISSAGWGIFISEIRGIRESGGDLKLIGMTPEVAEVFELLEFHNILESFKTVEAAVEKFERPKAAPVQEKPRSDESDKGTEPVAHGTTGQGTGAATASQVGTGTVGTAAAGDTSPNAGGTTTGSAPVTAGGAAAGNTTAGTASASSLIGTPSTFETESHAADVTSSKNLEAMIREIVREHPDYGSIKIARELLAHDYRRPINPLTLFMELKRLNLDTREKRIRYADSLAVAGSRK
ncbi:MAG: anti-sigma factor antagonist [Candidatus Eisenbacteria bacterium]|nr:anti-sigma factor antagonist [Candidatus Eisenbacteria bacterium]